MAPTIETQSRLERALSILETRLKAQANREADMPRGGWNHGVDAEEPVAAPAPRGWTAVDASIERPGTLETPREGQAFFALRSVRTGQAYTYKVSAANRGWFISLVDSPEAWGRYIGFVDGRDRRFRLTAASKLAADAPEVKAWAWTWERFVDGRPVEGVEVERVWENGR